jgi:hypothetical protein
MANGSFSSLARNGESLTCDEDAETLPLPVILPGVSDRGTGEFS